MRSWINAPATRVLSTEVLFAVREAVGLNAITGEVSGSSSASQRQMPYRVPAAPSNASLMPPPAANPVPPPPPPPQMSHSMDPQLHAEMQRQLHALYEQLGQPPAARRSLEELAASDPAFVQNVRVSAERALASRRGPVLSSGPEVHVPGPKAAGPNAPVVLSVGAGGDPLVHLSGAQHLIGSLNFHSAALAQISADAAIPPLLSATQQCLALLQGSQSKVSAAMSARGIQSVIPPAPGRATQSRAVRARSAFVGWDGPDLPELSTESVTRGPHLAAVLSAVVRRLHAGAQCDVDGLRFGDDRELFDHMQYLFKKKNAADPPPADDGAPPSRTRGFYDLRGAWARRDLPFAAHMKAQAEEQRKRRTSAAAGMVAADGAAGGSAAEERHQVPADGTAQTCCAISGDRLEKVFDAKEEVYYYTDACYVTVLYGEDGAAQPEGAASGAAQPEGATSGADESAPSEGKKRPISEGTPSRKRRRVVVKESILLAMGLTPGGQVPEAVIDHSVIDDPSTPGADLDASLFAGDTPSKPPPEGAAEVPAAPAGLDEGA